MSTESDVNNCRVERNVSDFIILRNIANMLESYTHTEMKSLNYCFHNQLLFILSIFCKIISLLRE